MTKQNQAGARFWLHTAILAILVLLLGGFSLFVGFHKAFSPLAELREHSAWTIHLPIWLGRVVGWAELLAAALLFGGLVIRPLARAGFWAALWISANHIVAAGFHVVHAEAETYGQSVVTISLCAVMCWLYSRRP